MTAHCSSDIKEYEIYHENSLLTKNKLIFLSYVQRPLNLLEDYYENLKINYKRIEEKGKVNTLETPLSPKKFKPLTDTTPTLGKCALITDPRSQI